MEQSSISSGFNSEPLPVFGNAATTKAQGDEFTTESNFSLASEAYHRMVYEWNKTDHDYPKNKTVHALFEDQVSRTPDAVALILQGESLSYRDLNERSNQLARYIRTQYRHKTNHELLPDTRVALFVERSPEMVIAILAVLKAGGAYVPVDTTYPQERVDYMLADAGAAIILSQRQLIRAGRIKLAADRVIAVDLQDYQLEDRSNLAPYSGATNLAYVIYTSGTTGKPKGVMVEHRSIVSKSHFYQHWYQVDTTLTTIFYRSYAFDGAMEEYLIPILHGGKMVIFPAGMFDLSLLVETIKKYGVTKINMPPQLLYTLIGLDATVLQSIRTLVSGGDKLHFSKLSKYRFTCEVFNAYGPTECTNDSHIYKLNFEDQDFNTLHSCIGKSVWDCKSYILDEKRNPVPVGVAGELYISGSGVARGYLNQGELTAERFVPNVFATEEDIRMGYSRMYKTGDRVQWLADGRIEYIGRMDEQLKIRGYRIEPGEIEEVISGLPGVGQSCIVVKERQAGSGTDKCLVGYYVADGKGFTWSGAEIIKELSGRLPEYMVPVALVELPSFPLNVNGKLDRGAFPEPDYSLLSATYVAPASAEEAGICAIWQSVLGLEKVGMTDDFFRIGGNSILAIQVSHEMSKAAGADVKVADIFTYRTLSQILPQIKGRAPVIIPGIGGREAVLSFAQQRLWFIERYEEGTNAYHLPDVYELEPSTEVDGMKWALQQVVARHEVLRSTIQTAAEGHGMQRVHTDPLLIEEIVLTEHQNYEQLIKTDINRPFDLAHEYPIRAKFYTIAQEQSGLGLKERKTFLLINIHHIATDGWSGNIFQKELAAYYEAYVKGDTGFSLPALEIQYKDYAVWQRAYLSGEVLQKHLSYWKARLTGYQTLELPTDYPRPERTDYHGATVCFTPKLQTGQALRALCRRYGVTMHTALLSSINILLSKYTGQDDIVTGSPIANRHQRQTANLIGFFVNVLVNRSLVDGEKSFEEIVRQVHQEQVQSQLHQDLPFEMLVNELASSRDTSRHPVFQVLFEVSGSVSPGSSNGSQSAGFLKPHSVEGNYEVEKFDLSISLDDSGEELTGQISYVTALFTRARIERLAASYMLLLDQLAAAPQQPCGRFSLLDAQTYHRMVYEWNKTDQAYPKDKTVHALFEAQVASTPDHTALIFQGESLSYRDLNERSNQLARYIRTQYRHKTNHELLPDTRVALFVERSPEMVIAILAVLKAGGAYVPVDTTYPQERVDYMLADAGAAIILSQRRLIRAGRIKLAADRVIAVNLQDYQLEDRSNLAPYSGATNLAYVIYTSGTTGKPKGVMVEHRSVVNTITALSAIYNKPSLKATAFTSYVFDVSVSEIFGSLVNGLELHVLAEEIRRDSTALSAYLINQDIHIVYLPPVLLSRMPQIAYPGLISVIYAGEPCDRQTALNWSSRVNLYNYYGPTEMSIYATGRRIDVDEVEQIGRSLPNIKSYVLDGHGQPLPIGVTGELYLAGAGVARGYLNQPELTAERFVPNPFATDADIGMGYTRLYKTGDLVRWLPEGNLEYIGRNDEQVKINGYRVELAEVTHAITCIAGIRQACVIARERQAGGSLPSKYLTCYYVPVQGLQVPSASFLQDKLSQVLPSYMVPGAYVAMDTFPLTVNGKLDKSALPDPDFSNAVNYVKPGSELEIKLCQIYGKILVLPASRISTHQNFFELGGNSILSIQLQLELNQLQEFRHLRVADIFKYNSVYKLIQSLQKDVAAGYKLRDNAVAGKNHEIAIIGVSGAFTGVDNIDQLWSLIENQQEAIRFHSDEECKRSGMATHQLDDPNFIRVSAPSSNVEYFDPLFWEMSPKEARQLDPQYRKFIEHCWFALESSGYVSQRSDHHIGIFAGSGDSDYLQRHILNSSLEDHVNVWEATNSNSKDALATKAAYFLNLSGPALSINTACSTGLVSVVEACKNLQLGTCDMALAGGVSLTMPDEGIGYLYEEGMILSRDGHCKTFDKEASGTTVGSGVGVVLLRRLEDALKENDRIWGVIKGYSTNNDGARKTGYSAPSVLGQSECIINAQKMAGVRSNQIDFVECHGTATTLGDPIEVQALHEAFVFNRSRDSHHENHKTVLGAIKANIGHAGSAAGIAGLIKVCAMLKNKMIPGQLNFKEPNPELHLERSHFHILTENRAWVPQLDRPRIAGVSSFGIGGTNAHVIIGDFIPPSEVICAPSNHKESVIDPQHDKIPYIILLSAKSRRALEHYRKALLDSLTHAKTDHQPYSIKDIAYTLQERKEHFNFRAAYCVAHTDQLINQLQSETSIVQTDSKQQHKLVFMFPGQGAQYACMAKALYDAEPEFKNIIDQCIALANQHLDVDLHEIMFPRFTSSHPAIDETQWTQISLFVTEYALAKYLHHLGFYADAYIGHSLGEYVAATLSGVFRLPDAIRLVIIRGKLMQSMQAGHMLAIHAPYDSVACQAKEYACEIACINSPDDVMVSGTRENIQRLNENFERESISTVRLNTSYGFHSALMEQAASQFSEAFKDIQLSRPRHEFISNVTGEIAKDEVVTSKYWCDQLRQTVQFAKGVDRLGHKYNHHISFIEVGPGKSLGYFIHKYKHSGNYTFIQTVQLLPSAKELALNEQLTIHCKEQLLAKLWLNALAQRPNSSTLLNGARFQTDLPLYQFDFQKCWIENRDRPDLRKSNSIDELCYKRSWQRADLPARAAHPDTLKDKNILVLINGSGQNQNRTDHLLKALQNHCYKVSSVTHRQVDNLRPELTFDFCDLAQVERFMNEAVLSQPIDIILYLSSTVDPENSCIDIFAVKHIFHWSKGTGNPIPKIVSVSFDNFEIIGTEQLQKRPSIVYGVTKSISLESIGSGIQHYHIDLSAQDSNGDHALFTQLGQESSTDLIAIRGNYQWSPLYQPVKYLASQMSLAGYAQFHPAVYLITGGLGGLGYAYARHITQSHTACIVVLLGRTAEVHLSEIARSRLTDLRRSRSQVIYSAIDIGREDADITLKSLLNRHQIKMIDIVLHAAGVAASQVVIDKTYAQIKSVVDPKITGIDNLIKVSGMIGIGYLICCSSVSSIFPSLGNMEYTAANLYLDEICHRTFPNIKHLLAINLNQVSDTGMSVNFLNSLERKSEISSDSISSYEFLEVLQRLIHAEARRSIVLSRYDVNTEYQHYAGIVTSQEEAQNTNKTEILEEHHTAEHLQIAQIFGKALGINEISIHDNFFNLGGNSMLAVWVSQRIMDTLKWNVRVADIFRLPSIDQLLSLRYQNCELIKPYRNNRPQGLNSLILIHPGFGGAEVYQRLAELLKGKYYCVGIDNYNIYNERKINSLNEIAAHYLSMLKTKHLIGKPIRFLGWSLGGLIAMEMAYMLEKEGYRDIHITLLDSFIQDDMMLNFLTKEDHESIRLNERNSMLMKYDKAYVEKVYSASDAELAIARTRISNRLIHADIVLFKASQVLAYDNLKGGAYKNEYIRKLAANNVDLVADKVQVFNLNCHHDNILETCSTLISDYLLADHTQF